VMRRIFDDFVAGGYSMRRICRRLYDDGIPSPTGRSAWSIVCISGMLANPTYKGRARYNRHQSLPPTTGRKSTRLKLRPAEEWIEIPVPAIISEDLFEAAQRVARDHSYFSPRRSQPDQWLLRRLVVCGHCGVKCYCQDHWRGARHGLRYYVCNRRRSLEAGGPDRACPQPSTRAEELDSLVWEQVRQALLQPEILVKGQAVVGARAGRPDDELLNAQLERLDRRSQQTDNERRRVLDLYQMQPIELADFKTRHQEVISRHRQFERERETLLAQCQELAVNNRLSRKVETFARDVRHGIDALNFEQRQKLIRLLVEQVSLGRPSRFICAFHWMSMRPPIPLGLTRSQSSSTTSTRLINRVCVRLVEIWLSILVRKLLRRGNFRSVEDLRNQVLAFIAYFNRTMAKPFKWTYQGKPLHA
jgi:site-specific DNA recombinase